MQSNGAKGKEEREICCMYVGMSARIHEAENNEHIFFEEGHISDY